MDNLTRQFGRMRIGNQRVAFRNQSYGTPLSQTTTVSRWSTPNNFQSDKEYARAFKHGSFERSHGLQPGSYGAYKSQFKGGKKTRKMKRKGSTRRRR